MGTRRLRTGAYTTIFWPEERDEVSIVKDGSTLVAEITLRDWREWFNAYGRIEAAKRIWEGSVAKRERAIRSGTPGADHRG